MIIVGLSFEDIIFFELNNYQLHTIVKPRSMLHLLPYTPAV